ncbi:MAG: hypothetical protein IH942_05275 [Acidobacteria bacterium]|nr:hypothetical protein [Acidobacteriota bacterium]
MGTVDRVVRAAVFRLLVAGLEGPTLGDVAEETGLEADEVARSFLWLADEHRLTLSAGKDRVVMAHPFSGVSTDYRSRIGNSAWWANCGWDAFGILALLGDGEVVDKSGNGGEPAWTVADGVVTPAGLVHFVVPAAQFWDDIAFT